MTSKANSSKESGIWVDYYNQRFDTMVSDVNGNNDSKSKENDLHVVSGK